VDVRAFPPLRRGRLPWHPVTVHLPLGLLAGGWVGLVGAAGWPSSRWDDVVSFCLVAGLAGATLSVTTGFVELARLGSRLAGTPAERTLTAHLIAVLCGATSFGAALWLHRAGYAGAALGTATAGLVALAAGGHLGGRLVYRHNIGTEHEPRAVESA
jgi:uncharacterized membrane protein